MQIHEQNVLLSLVISVAIQMMLIMYANVTFHQTFCKWPQIAMKVTGYIYRSI